MNSKLEDELYSLICRAYLKERRQYYIDAKYYIRHWTIYFQKLFKQIKSDKLKQLANLDKKSILNFSNELCIYCIVCYYWTL